MCHFYTCLIWRTMLMSNDHRSKVTSTDNDKWTNKCNLSVHDGKSNLIGEPCATSLLIIKAVDYLILSLIYMKGNKTISHPVFFNPYAPSLSLKYNHNATITSFLFNWRQSYRKMKVDVFIPYFFISTIPSLLNMAFFYNWICKMLHLLFSSRS